MIFAQLLNSLLLIRVVLRSDDLIHPPLIAGCGGKHAAHQVIMSVGMVKRVQRVEAVNAELVRRDENGSAGAQRDIAHAAAYGSRADSCRGVVAGARGHDHMVSQAKFFSNAALHAADRFIALEQLRKLLFPDGADVHHLF